MNKLRAWYLKLPNAVKAAWHTAWLSFVATFGLSLLGFLHDVQEWAGDAGNHSFPSVTPLGKAVLAAVVALVSAVLNYLFRVIKPGPTYPNTPKES